MFSDSTERRAKLTAEQSNLERVDLRLRGLRIHSPNSPEITRLETARADLVARMSKEDLANYQKLMKPVKSKEQIKAEAEAERAAMDANKDRPPI